MRILILGGTQFVGRHIVESMLVGGHRVTVFNRGITPDFLPPEVERLRGDRNADGGLNTLRNRKWDACVDVSGCLPKQVRATAELLRKNVAHYVLISAVSVYGNPARGPVTEDYARLQPASDLVTELNTTEIYGACKVACEDIVQDIYGYHSTLLRPQIVAGPYEQENRFQYWVWRATQPGEMLAPGDGTDYLQVIDARDVGQFSRLVIENKINGSFNLAGQRVNWSDLIRILGAKYIAWVSSDILTAANLTVNELRLYRQTGGYRSSLMHVCNKRSIAAGLTVTDLSTTVADTRKWIAQHPVSTPEFSADMETGLINRARCV